MSLANSIKGQKSFLLASKDGEMFKLDTKEIFYIESVDNKTFIYCKNNIYETKQKLYELEEIYNNLPRIKKPYYKFIKAIK